MKRFVPPRSPTRSSTASFTTLIGSIWPAKAFARPARPPEIHPLLTNQKQRNIINPDLRRQTPSVRLQIGTLSGFRSELVSGFLLE